MSRHRGDETCRSLVQRNVDPTRQSSYYVALTEVIKILYIKILKYTKLTTGNCWCRGGVRSMSPHKTHSVPVKWQRKIKDRSKVVSRHDAVNALDNLQLDLQNTDLLILKFNSVRSSLHEHTVKELEVILDISCSKKSEGLSAMLKPIRYDLVRRYFKVCRMAASADTSKPESVHVVSPNTHT
jgi:hypothetical protein